MPVRAVVLFSGGLDSMLAVRLLQAQGLAVQALNFRTQFTCCQQQATLAARELQVPLTVVAPGDDYLELVRRPRHGYGRGANPCLDCRIYMFRKAAQLARQEQADLVASGEVVGQRPMSQKKRDLALIAHAAGLDDRLLRPLSALLLPPIAAEREGLVDRQRLGGFQGRGRRGLIALAKQLGIERIPQPSSGCALTSLEFGQKVFQLLRARPDASGWEFDLLRMGRHTQLDAEHRLILGRREAENAELVLMARRDDAQNCLLLRPGNFTGPSALLVGPAPWPWRDAAGQAMLAHTNTAPEVAVCEVLSRDGSESFSLARASAEA